MAYVYIATGYLRHPKLTRVSRQAVLLHLASILWTAEHLTDGYLPSDALKRVQTDARIDPRTARERRMELVANGLWDQLPDGAFRVHDFEVHNRSATREAVEQNRAAWVERQRRHRDAMSRRDG